MPTCGGFREHLPVEVRADFERLILCGSRALEFLASQGCMALGNLVLSRRDSLLADVHSTVPTEEVARLRYSPLPETVALFPSPLLDSTLTKMRRTTLLFNGPSIRPGFIGNLRRRVGQLGRRRLALGRQVPLELDRPRNRRRRLLLPARLARRGRMQGQGSLFLVLGRLWPLLR